MTQLSAAQTGTPGSSSGGKTLYGGKGTRRITVRDIALAKERGEKWPMLTAYDAMTASVFDEAGIPVMLVDEFPDWNSIGPQDLPNSPVTLHYYVEDIDAAYRKAVEAGARAVMEPQDMFWGDRYGVLRDPFGHNWSMATHIRDVSPEEALEASKTAMACPENTQ